MNLVVLAWDKDQDKQARMLAYPELKDFLAANGVELTNKSKIKVSISDLQSTFSKGGGISIDIESEMPVYEGTPK